MKKHCIWSLMTLVLLLGVLVFLCACDGSGSGSRMAERREEQADHGRDPVPGIPDDMEFDTNPDPMINDEDEPTGIGDPVEQSETDELTSRPEPEETSPVVSEQKETTIITTVTTITTKTTTKSSTTAQTDKTKDVTTASVQKTTKAEPTGTVDRTETDKNFKYMGNANTKKLHLTTCDSASRTKESNRVYFETREEAIAAGYEPCQRCKP